MSDESTLKTAPERKRLLGYLCFLVVIAGAVLAFSQLRSEEPASGSGYYTGPMLNKAGTHYVTADGKIVPPPPGSPPVKPRDADDGKRGER